MKVKEKSKKFIPLSCDLMFKKVFGDSNNIERLESLLAMYLDISFEQAHGNIHILNNEKTLKNKNGKRQAMDILVRMELNGESEIINIEVNKNKQGELVIERKIGYVSYLYSSNMKSKQDYKETEPVLQINFDIFDLYNSNNIVNKYYYQNDKQHKLTQKLQIHHVNIEKCKKIWYDEDVDKYSKYEQKIIKFGALLGMETFDEFKRCLEGIDMNDKIKEDIESSVKEYNEDENWWCFMTKEEDEIAMRNGEISLATERGIEQGAKEEKFNIAKKMLNKNMDNNVISELTGLRIDEIKDIMK